MHLAMWHKSDKFAERHEQTRYADRLTDWSDCNKNILALFTFHLGRTSKARSAIWAIQMTNWSSKCFNYITAAIDFEAQVQAIDAMNGVTLIWNGQLVNLINWEWTCHPNHNEDVNNFVCLTPLSACWIFTRNPCANKPFSFNPCDMSKSHILWVSKFNLLRDSKWFVKQFWLCTLADWKCIRFDWLYHLAWFRRVCTIVRPGNSFHMNPR